jgi:hypothetical protein
MNQLLSSFTWIGPRHFFTSFLLILFAIEFCPQFCNCNCKKLHFVRNSEFVKALLVSSPTAIDEIGVIGS